METSHATVPGADRHVKPFSIVVGGLALGLCAYCGWFLSNALLLYWPGAGWPGWVVFLLGVALGPVAAWSFFQRGRGRSLRLMMAALWIIVFSMHIRTCLVERVEIAGDSMTPALSPGDVVWIEKWSTGLQLPELSFPFGRPSPTNKIPLTGLARVNRGDVVVISYPGLNDNGRGYLIKRVIGLPGEYYELIDGRVYINGQEQAEPYLPRATRTAVRPEAAQLAVQSLPESLALLSTEVQESARMGIASVGRIPRNTVLVLGDNRSVSRDSRTIGFVPVFFIQGKVIGEY